MISIPDQFLLELNEGGKLFGLEKPSREEIQKVRNDFPNLSFYFWAFVTEIGVGHAHHSGASVCLPYALDKRSNHPSLQLYKGFAYQSLRAILSGAPIEAKQELPSHLVVVSDPGASWYHCLDMQGGDNVYTYDLGRQEIELNCTNFFAFILEAIDFEPCT